MISGYGVDLTSVERIRAFASEELALKRVFTPAEIAECLSNRLSDRRLAMVFAAKEAVMKALGTGWAKGVGWKEIEVTGLSKRPLSVSITGTAEEMLGKRNLALDVSSTVKHAVAVAVIE